MRRKLSGRARSGFSLGNHSALWCDQYALTMAQAFFSAGQEKSLSGIRHDTVTTFHAFIRSNPFDGSYLITGGQNIILDWLVNYWRFDKYDIASMRTSTLVDPQTGESKPLYTPEFIDMCASAEMELSIDAIREGDLAFPYEPIYRVTGALWQCLMVEAAILNVINSQSLFATLASRLVEVAEGGPVLEFGLRRAQCIGGLESSRGSYIGGVTATSNKLAEKYFGIPSAGTFAHALVMVHENELQAFKEYAGAMPYNGIFLVDTYDTLQGVQKAVTACQEMGITLKGIRLDSGDLAYLSIEARKILDEAGFKAAKIAASNDLDEETIQSLKQQGARIDLWGVGTNLVTSKAQPALGAVYKLGAVYNGNGLSQQQIQAARTMAMKHQNPDAIIREVIKISEQPSKSTLPGELDVIRFVANNAGAAQIDGDTIYAYHREKPPVKCLHTTRDIVSVRKEDDTLRKMFPAGTAAYRPLQPLLRGGRPVREIESVATVRHRAQKALRRLDASHRRLLNPHRYIAGLDKGLYERRHKMMQRLRG